MKIELRNKYDILLSSTKVTGFKVVLEIQKVKGYTINGSDTVSTQTIG